MSASGRALSAALNKPEDWIVGQYTITHKKSRLEFWIANGRFFLDRWNGHIGGPRVIGLLERHWLWIKVRNVIGEAKRAELEASEKAVVDGLS